MPRRSTPGATPTGDERKRPSVGSVRRAQQITTYGVGGLLAVADQSYIVSGLDTWDVTGEPDLRDQRLEPMLHVNGFRRPPAARVATGRGVRVRRFPDTYACPQCKALKAFRDLSAGDGDNRCARCATLLTPSRFMVACEDGHLDEFPYEAWVHADPDRKDTHPRTCSQATRELTLETDGRTASLRSIVISCSCGREASMEGAFGKTALRRLGLRCQGARPWLGRDATERGCKQPLQTLQRGSSAAWFADMRSALSIPPWHTELMELVEAHRRHLVGKSDERIAEFAQDEGWLTPGGYSASQVLHTVRTLENAAHPELTEDDEDKLRFAAGEPLRQEEYEQLSKVTEDTPENKHFVCESPEEADRFDVPGVDRVMLVKRLREVRVLTGFTRIRPPQGSKADRDRIGRLSKSTDLGWLPAVDVVGEGVFLTLDQGRLRQWESALLRIDSQRTELMRAAHTDLLREQEWENPRSPLTSRFVLLHTLAHALINEWSLDCGYPAASLRERLYVDDEMCGVLLYTATSDSAGSLGGIVARGEVAELSRNLSSALERAAWCSCDPLCMETDANGVGGLNLAACHACVLLPETSCEMNNTFLDRAHLVGTPANDFPGYFA
ncbi:DrmB family protein [Streptomyces sp. NPDC058295]|uniref:DrmB family protein n=1 Tax=Streptomyces sp. NPDC058295 TaxID=3346431 RepID=UPI0036EEF03D